MSKLYEQYQSLKKHNPSQLYLFKNGKFYIFLAEDADYINQYVVLKKTKFTNEIYKCGFPENSLTDYLRVFANHKISLQIVEPYTLDSKNDNASLISQLRSIDIDRITPVEALLFLKKIKEEIQ